MASEWTTQTDSWRQLPPPIEDEMEVVRYAQECLTEGQSWEAEFRVRFDYDYKFANGDTHNKYQWDSDLILKRELEDRPILTVNKVQQHNLLIINDSKQNKSDVRIRPVGDEASFEGAQLYQELIYHIQYISSADNVYDKAIEWQVNAGRGAWYVTTEFLSSKSFDQEIKIKLCGPLGDPRGVYFDPHTIEPDKSDMRWALIFEDMDKKLYEKEYPKFIAVGSSTVLGEHNSSGEGWLTKDNVRIAILYKKEEKTERLVSFLDDKKERQEGFYSELTSEGKKYYQEAKKLPTTREREVVTNKIWIYKIAGNRIIQKTQWLGETIPVVILSGVETIIDNIYDCRGHTRALINPQQIYNYNTSANVEFGALQTKSPYVAAALAIEGYEEYYKTANSINHSYLPYNAYDDDGNALQPPQRSTPPMPSEAYVKGLEIAQNELMMASGQYQAQMGENENAKSGVAINARQRQGDRATYHFIDSQAIAIRRTGKILIEVIPKVYDTKRIIKITSRDNVKKQITIDPNAPQALQKGQNLNPELDIAKQIEQYIFNPNVGMYDIQSDTGPSFATKRQEAANALMQLASTDKNFMSIAGDLYFGTMDFPDANVLAERYRRTIPPNIIGNAPDPQTEQLMHQAADHIQQLQGAVAALNQKLEDKQLDQSIELRRIDLEEKKISVEQQRLDYEAETKRVTALGNSGPGLSVEQIQPVVRELLSGMARNGELVWNAKGPHEGGSPMMLPEVTGGAPTGAAAPPTAPEQPPIPGAAKAPDGNWYLQHPNGQHMQVMNGGQ